jgi:hypothetical protein
MNLTRSAMLCLALGLSLAASPAMPLTRATAAGGMAFVAGGVGEAEARAMEGERDKYSLWIITAARGTGAFLADVTVRITDAQNRVLFDQRLDGPWLMIDLPLGKYTVQAIYKDQNDRRTTTIHSGDHHQMVFHFSAPDDVAPAVKSGASAGGGR